MDSTPLASAEIASAIQQLESSNTPNKAQSYSQLLRKILDSSTPDTLAPNLIAYIESILGDTLGIVASRPLLSEFAECFKELKNPEVKVEVGQRAFEILHPRAGSFEEQDTAIKESVAQAYQQEEDYVSAARVLQSITLDSPQRRVSADYKAELWIRIVRCYLEEEDPTSANGYLNRVKNILPDVQNRETRVHFHLCQARILDSQRQFLDASSAYLAISLEPMVEEEERLTTLSEAIKCAVLAPAGPQRSRTLARLYKDDRATSTEEHAILEKIFLDRLLEPAEVKAFADKLKPHQLALTADGSTVLDKAILDHNLLAASRLYANIHIDALAGLLGVDRERAERDAAKMIEQGRLAGHIDQIEEVVFFGGEGTGEKLQAGQSQGDTTFGSALKKWDANVQGLAEEVERVTTMLQNEHPEFYEAHMVH
ncbi:COP9 signalosome subunit CsnD [Viridothelium virens]|uniref:COP9 signalosome complex subunit 4 n=1 Tax=Viridothelium virens TaxID=1048519 RepID=A0A6A6GTF4_VIRVR|nr:COP9 signalosome subunit CsnD [Viridothelium virens]